MNTRTQTSKKPVVWAIDPFEGKNAERAPLAKFLTNWTKGKSPSILPFSVISPGGLRWPVPVSYDFGRDLKAYGIKSVKKNLGQLKMTQTATPEVEVRDNSSRRELVNDVLKFAKKRKAGFIAVNTKTTASKSPFKLGGFAEAIIEQSELPILAVGPNAEVSGGIKEILFPTDLTERSHKAFVKVLGTAKDFGASVHLLFVARNPAIPYAGMDFGAAATWVMESEALQREENRKVAEKWCREAKTMGVSCDYRMVKTFESTARAITKFAKSKHYDLIALASYRTTKTPALLGGTIRSVLASAETPVMEIRAAK
ncbi:MAG: universal stress protein [Bacteriovoracia bacterium]